MHTYHRADSRDDRASDRHGANVGSRLRPGGRDILGLQRSVGNATVAAMFPPSILQRADVHTDKELFDKMQEFRKKNNQLSESQQNKIFWSVKRATSSDEVAYTFFNYYSGWTGSQIVIMSPEEEKKAKEQDRLAETKSGGDTKLRADVLNLPEERLGPLLLHEFSHTGHHQSVAGAADADEGQAYGVEYHYAERTGDTTRMVTIRAVISDAAIVMPALRPALKQNFKVTYALMKALDELAKTGSSTLPPLAGKTSNDGRVMAAQFVSNFQDLSKDLQRLWNHIRDNLASFPVPEIL